MQPAQSERNKPMAEEKQMILNIEMGRCVSGDGTDVLKCYACGEAAAP